jgi:hypothetical protein
MNEEEQVSVKLTEGTDEPISGEVHVAPEASADEATPKANPRKAKGARSLKDTIEQVEVFGQAVSEALQGRGNVVMVRVNDEALQHLDMLVEAEVTKSRSESAAFLINEGIAGNQELFGKISAITQRITELRDLLRQEVMHQPKE